MKKLLFQSLTDKDASEFKLEMKILSKLNHPNIVKMLGIFRYLYWALRLIVCYRSLCLFT